MEETVSSCPVARVRVTKEVYQLDMIDGAISNPAGTTVSIDVAAEIGGNSSREVLMVTCTSTHIRVCIATEKGTR